MSIDGMDRLQRANLEDEIEQRGLVQAYQSALIDVLGLDMQVFNSAIEINPHQDIPTVPNNTFKWDGHAFLWAYHRAVFDDCKRAAATVGVTTPLKAEKVMS